MAYTQDFRQKIVDLYLSGHSTTKIRKEFGVPAATITGWVKKSGGQIRTGLDAYSTAEFRQSIIDLYMSGITSPKIHKDFGVSEGTVTRWVKLSENRVRNHPYTRRSDEFKRKVVDLYLSGVPSPQLAKQFGIADKSVRNWVYAFGESVRTIHPTVLSPDGTSKTCSLCGLMKLLEKFAINPAGVGGRHAACKSCHKKRMRKTKYGLSSEDFDNILNIQGGVCAICGKKAKESKHTGWYVDHDHSCCSGEYTCGKCVRGILCPTCNHGLGHFRDNEELLSKAILYLRKHRETTAIVETISKAS